MRRICIILFLIAILFRGPFSLLHAHAQSADDLRQKINGQNEQIKALEKEIANYQSQLAELGGKKDTLTNAIKELDISAKKLNTDIKVTEAKIGSANLKLQELSLTIHSTSNTITDREITIRRLLLAIQEQDNKTLVEQLVLSNSLSESWRYISEVATVEEQVSARLKELRTEKQMLVDRKTETEKTKKTLASLEGDLRNQKKIVEANAKAKSSLLKETKNEEANYSKLLAQKKLLKDQFARDLATYEAQLRFALDPSQIPKAGGIFSWPVDKVIITQLFGKTSSSGRLYASGSHNGVDFGVPLGTPVRAVLSGVVLGSGNTDLTCKGTSYGNWILIKHDNGLTSVFGHLSLVTAQTGSRVETGQIVAYSGSTGYSTGPHLHVTIFASTGVSIKNIPSTTCGGKTYTQPVAAHEAYLDPMLYFSTYTGKIY